MRPRDVDDGDDADRRSPLLPVDARRFDGEDEVEILPLVEPDLVVGEAGSRLHVFQRSDGTDTVSPP
jgi:hypothetical protein